MRERVLVAAMAAAMAIGVAGCDEPLSDLAGPTPNLEPTFSSIQREIFDNTDSSGRVRCTQCHNPGGRPFTGGLDLTGSPYDRLVGVASTQRPSMPRIDPGNPDNSYLIHKIEGRPGIVGVRMPLAGPPLTDGQIQLIRRWIALGARND